MNAIRKTDEYEEWFLSLRDIRAKARINTRIRRLEVGNPGDVAPVGGSVNEMRIDFGPGYRVYFKQIGMGTYLILYGGDKSSQDRDIVFAKQLAGERK